ncbi:MAG: hypothetical protein ACJ76H_09945 [Bacteriovoracaceae bacterium]
MKMFIALSMLLSVSAFASDRKGFDCRTGDDPYGGKLCVYVISQCFMENISEAAECAIHKYASNVLWDDIHSIKPLSLNLVEHTVVYEIESDKGRSTQTVTYEEGPDFYGKDVIKPVALKIER